MLDDTSETWHYGLMARWWAEFNQPDPEEIAYLRAAIERFGQPALDLGCGTGRLLTPLLAEGLDVDGVDDTFHPLRVGDYRVMYDVLDADRVVLVLGIAHRGDLERWIRNR